MSNLTRQRNVFKGLAIASRALHHADRTCGCGNRFCVRCNGPKCCETFHRLLKLGWTYDEIEAYIYYRTNKGPRRQLLLQSLGLVALDIAKAAAKVTPA